MIIKNFNTQKRMFAKINILFLLSTAKVGSDFLPFSKILTNINKSLQKIKNMLI